MKYFIILFIITILSVTSITSQDQHVNSYKTTDAEVINLDIEYGDIKVSFEDVDELQVIHNLTVNGTYDPNMVDISNKTRNGVFSLTFSLDFEEVEERVTVRSENGNKQVFTIKEYNKIKNTLRSYSHTNFGYDIEGEITIIIPNDKAVKINTTYGDLDIVHQWTDKDHDLEFHSTYGHVDLAIPETTSSKIELLTSYGEIYSNLNFKTPLDGSSKDCGQGEKIITTLNSNPQGTIALEATYDNIYLRKI